MQLLEGPHLQLRRQHQSHTEIQSPEWDPQEPAPRFPLPLRLLQDSPWVTAPLFLQEGKVRHMWKLGPTGREPKGVLYTLSHSGPTSCLLTCRGLCVGPERVVEAVRRGLVGVHWLHADGRGSPRRHSSLPLLWASTATHRMTRAQALSSSLPYTR